MSDKLWLQMGVLARPTFDGDSFSCDSLTTEQKAAADAIAAFLASDEREFVLVGYAGTGKTYTIGHALKNVRHVIYTAPTHKAVGVLRDSGVPGEVQTIHSLLACRKRYDYTAGTMGFFPNYEKETASQYAVIVVDEASMISGEMRGWLRTAINDSKTKIIWMGDPCQLPPVNDESVVFQLTCAGARLETIMRNGGDVQAAATRVRLHIGDAATQYAPDGVGVYNVGQDEFLGAYLERRETAKLLAWTNDTVDWLNDWVREQLYDDALPYHEHERLVVVDSWADSDGTRMLHAEDELVVLGYEDGEELGLPVHRVFVTHGQYGQTSLNVLNPSAKGQHAKRMNALKAQAKASGSPYDWREYFGFLEAFVRVRPGWATTVHKSQGSTYEQAFVVQTNIKGCKDHLMRNMLTYVAYSRAKSELWLA